MILNIFKYPHVIVVMHCVGSRRTAVQCRRLICCAGTMWRRWPGCVVARQLAQYDRHCGHFGYKLRPWAQGEYSRNHLSSWGSWCPPSPWRQCMGCCHWVRRPTPEKGSCSIQNTNVTVNFIVILFNFCHFFYLLIQQIHHLTRYGCMWRINVVSLYERGCPLLTN